MYTKQDFIERFKDQETAMLLHRLANSELADEARGAIYHLLHERGVPTEPLDDVRPDIPEEEVAQHARTIKHGECPRCHRRESMIDVRDSYWIWSVVVFTRREVQRKLCCQRCGVQLNWRAVQSCAVLGWWGIPAGIIFTPAQIVLNLWAIANHKRDRSEPSSALLAWTKKGLLAKRQLELERMAE